MFEPTLCYKIIHDKDEYLHVNSVAKETEFLTALAELKVADVRTPRPYYWAMHEDFHILSMERLPATSLDQILYGKEKFPDTFNAGQFCEKLEKYIEAMHEIGIHHRDLNPQNIMVDHKTGNPYIIDFGKSRFALTSEDPYLERNEETKTVYKYPEDTLKIAELKQKIKEYLALS
jgi:tRNA A-37 threonylcarbamoyl transferase component Bud32